MKFVQVGDVLPAAAVVVPEAMSVPDTGQQNWSLGI
jgi:hypothetical protein